MDTATIALIINTTHSLLKLLSDHNLALKDIAARVERSGGTLSDQDLNELEQEAQDAIDRLRNATR